MAQSRPRIRALSQSEAEAILARNHVGRMAYIRDGEPEIVPIGYVFSGGAIYGRTSPGAKVTALQHNDRVAFEVDEVEAPLTWRSVVAHGTFRWLKPVGSNATAEAWERAVALLSALVPGSLTMEDPVPHRWLVFQICPDRVTGRASSTDPPGDGGGDDTTITEPGSQGPAD